MLKVCLIGCGRVAKSHAASAKEVPNDVKIVALVDVKIKEAEAFKNEFGIPHAFADFEEAVAAVEFDAVDICLPNHLHKEMAIKCARAGKHVLVEKPMANTVAECEEMIKAADEAGVILMVGQSRRFYSAVLKSKEMVDKGEIGELVSISANLYGYLEDAPTLWWKDMQKAGGLMIPIWGAHIIDYCLWMFDGLPERVYCETASVNPNWQGEDEVTILLGFTKNRFATIRMSWNTKLNEKKWEGGGKMLSSSDILYERYIQGTKHSLYLRDETELKRNGTVLQQPDSVGNFAMQYQEFAASVAEGRKPLTAGDKIINVIRVQEAALKSAAEHNVIKL